MAYPQKRGGTKPVPTDYDFFTGGDTKTADFTIYYNIAFDNIDRVNKQLLSKTQAQRNSFLAEYLWKAHLQNKNSDGYELTPQDKKIIPELIKKVEEIRNFHSHVWHDNAVLQFSNELKTFVERQYEEAKAAIYKELPGAVMDYEYMLQNTYKDKFVLFKNVKGVYFITLEGRVFFLSFFLTTGQMSQFLQQRTGNKRADLPQFKIKRLLYTFYCHRDGAAITDFNHEDRFIDTLDKKERDDIFKARTAFKLVSYLFDYPDYWGSKEAMPLFDSTGELIKNVTQLKQYIEGGNLLPGLNFTLIDRKTSGFSDDETEEEKLIKAQEDKHRTGTIAFTFNDASAYHFHINFESLHRLVLLQILHGDSTAANSPLNTLKEELNKQTQNRVKLYAILTKNAESRTEKEQAYLLDRQNQYLRGGRQLTEAGIVFFENIGKALDEKEKEALLLANYIRPAYKEWLTITDRKGNEKEALEPEPILVHQQDFVLGTRQKFRAGNRFVFYTAKYLMDFAGDDWYWGMEKFELVKLKENAPTETLIKKKTYFKASAIPLDEDYRLTLEENHIYLALLKDEHAKTNHQKYHQFAIGPNALRYLAAYIYKNESEYRPKLNQFLQTLSADLDKLQRSGKYNETDGYVLLENAFVADYLKPSESPLDGLKQKLTTRIAYIKAEWDNALNNRHYLSRATKNKLVMDAYRLFDWASEETPDGKFLRANEYNQMSVCHYSLHLKEPVKGRRGQPDKLGKYDYLFQTLFKLAKRLPPLPDEIKDLLNKAKNLDHLMELVFADRTYFLDNLTERLSLPSQLLKKQLPDFCRKLGFSVPPSLLKEPDQQALKEKHHTTLAVQPFVVHPMLVLKHFFEREYQAGKTLMPAINKDGQAIKKRPVLNILGDVRKNIQLSRPLHPDFYKAEITSQLYPDAEQKPQLNKLNGLINTTHTEDILLWWMAQRYLADNDFTKAIGELVKSERGITLTNLNSLVIKLPLTNTDTADPIATTLYTSVLMHQLDDMMFLTEKSRLRRAAVHFIKRCTVEKELWEDDLQNLSINQLDGGKLPDGSKSEPIAFQLLRDELELVRRNGQKLAAYILAFEKAVLQATLSGKYKANKDQFQAWLLADFKKGKEQKAHFNFDSILGLAKHTDKGNDAIISEYRNITFHNDVPIGEKGSFAWLTRKGTTIRELLQITEDLNTKKDRSAYLPVQGDENEPIKQ